MACASALVRWTPDALVDAWRPTTLDLLGKSEEYFETVLATSPELLGLQTRRSGIRGPFRVFRQLEVATPSGRMIYPDIVLLAPSGHLIVVEVKRFVNSELRDRAVIAQIIDYASSFAALSEEQLAALFGGDAGVLSWAEVVERLFPEESDADDLAATLLRAIQSGELNLVIACDKIPAGLPAIVGGIASQSALGFDLDLIEVTPFVREVSETAEIVFVPTVRQSTEIVARTAVTVTYRESDQQPSVSVTTSTPEEIKENTEEAELGRMWSPEEVEAEFTAWGEPVALELLRFVKENSADGRLVPRGRRQHAVLAFWVNATTDDGAGRSLVVFSCTNTWPSVGLYLGPIASVASPALLEEYHNGLKRLFGGALDVTKKYPGVSFDLLLGKMQEFTQLILWLKSTLETRVKGDPADVAHVK